MDADRAADEAEEVLAFWFPDRADDEPAIHDGHWAWRMRGGADEEIVARFAPLTRAAAAGELDGWADNARGRLALIVVLDQFSRSLWRDDPRAFAQDAKALALAVEGHGNGHYEALRTPWERTVYNLPLGHCEGPDHLDRLDLAMKLGAQIHASAPDRLKPGYGFAASQAVEVRKVIAAFGRHPHRNAVLGREATPEEEAYVAAGRFPHLRTPDGSR